MNREIKNARSLFQLHSYIDFKEKTTKEPFYEQILIKVADSGAEDVSRSLVTTSAPRFPR